MQIFWGVASSTEVFSWDELEELLDSLTKLACGKGMIVQAANHDGRTLAFGIGRSESVLTFFDEQGRSFTSVGDRERGDYLTFEFGGDISERMGAKAIPDCEAKNAVREFFETGHRPCAVEWELEY